MKTFQCLLLGFLSTLLIVYGTVSPKLSQSLSSSLALADDKTRFDIVIEMEEGVASVIDAKLPTLSTSTILSREDKAILIGQGLVSHAASSQKNVLSLLTQSARLRADAPEVFSSWISNFVFVRGADKNMIQALGATPGIAGIREQIVIKLETLVESDSTILANGWNVDKIGASDFWKSNSTGTGILVGHIDSGVRYTHFALRSNWIGGAGGWYAPRNASSRLPYESSSTSHGTHTLATAVGADGIGVAPGADWTSCIGCLGDNNCFEQDLNACGQFMFCPTDPAQASTCSRIPRIVTNSWGSSNGGLTFYDRVIESWHAVGIIPIFAAGNAGPNCNTIGSPGDHRNVISVGSTNQNDAISRFSSIGPNFRSTNFKPDIVAPGDSISSATAASDTSFGILSGTSMATPHVAGAVALLLSSNPNLNYATVKKTLLETAKRTGLTPYPGVPLCENIADNTYPNHKFGYGRLELRNVTVPENNIGRGHKLYAGTVMCLVLLNVVISHVFVTFS